MKKMLFNLLLFCLPLFACSQTTTINEHYLLVGTYTGGKSKGVYVYRFNSTTGKFTFVNTAITPDPSYLTVSPDKKFVYTVNSLRNSEAGTITAFSFNQADGSLKQLNAQSSGGANPCYIAIDKTGKWITTGNYSGGSLSVLPVATDGSLAAASTTIQHTGSSVHVPRQEKAHVHATVFSPDNRYLFVPDLGLDKIMVYTFNASNGSIKAAPTPFTQLQPGAGPRHFTFHPAGKYAYVIEELSGKVTAFTYAAGVLEPIQTISALADNFKGIIGSADIHVSPDGKFLYASNRGESNTIAIFSVDDRTGLLTIKGHQSTMGKVPRNFNFDPSGNFLLVANQDSDEIVIFKRDPKTGLLTDTGSRIEVPNPVCIKWIE